MIGFDHYKGLPELADGWVTLNEKPGLGLELNEDAVKEFGAN
jgi:L-alanine-DL-glutamate epimerase-like enolase superfamily enzyme